MLKSIKQLMNESKDPTIQELSNGFVKLCDHCEKPINLTKDSWIFQENGSYIHLDCVAPALEAYKAMLDELVPTMNELLKLDPREPFLNTENYHETCEWCGHITDSPFETHVCPERV